jgi:hypothetical protein
MIEVVLDLHGTLQGEPPVLRRPVRLRAAPDRPVVFDVTRVGPDGEAPPQLLLLALPE